MQSGTLSCKKNGYFKKLIFKFRSAICLLTLTCLTFFLYYFPPIFFTQLTCMTPGVTCTCSIFTSSLENSVDPDQLASKKPADLDLNWFQSRIYPGLACRWVTVTRVQDKML